MIFKLHSAMALELIALVAGTFLMIKACKEDFHCKGFAKFVGIFVVAASLLLIVCGAYHSFEYWRGDHGEHPRMKHGEMMHEGTMKEGMKRKMRRHGEGVKKGMEDDEGMRIRLEDEDSPKE